MENKWTCTLCVCRHSHIEAPQLRGVIVYCPSIFIYVSSTIYRLLFDYFRDIGVTESVVWIRCSKTQFFANSCKEQLTSQAAGKFRLIMPTFYSWHDYNCNFILLMFHSKTFSSGLSKRTFSSSWTHCLYMSFDE